MMHSDPDALAAVAMGETDVSADDLRHIEFCAECSREIRSLRRVAELARSGPAEDALSTPSDEVWQRISSTLGLRSDVVPASVGSPAVPAPVSAPVSAPVTELRRPRSARRRHTWILPVSIAASVALIAGVTGAVVVAQRPTSTVLADVKLEALPEWDGSSGDARIERAADGERDVVVTLATSAPSSDRDYREVWLISADLSKLVSVGVLSGDSGTFSIPAGVDLADYPIVDISSEKVDGDPEHSGDSIVRGELSS